MNTCIREQVTIGGTTFVEFLAGTSIHEATVECWSMACEGRKIVGSFNGVVLILDGRKNAAVILDLN